MDEDINEAVSALLDDDSGSDWEKEFCSESETSYCEPLRDVHSPKVDVSIDNQGVPEPLPDHMKVLKSSFGHSNFRPMQWKIIHSIIEKKEDNCLIMATGYGKSLCYQFPAVYKNGTTIVISPLISLMQDQVLSLKVANISSCFLGSAQSKSRQVMEEILNGEYRIVYMTPEFITGDSGEYMLKQIKKSGVTLTLIAVDEAHCVSQWGHDFRHSYRNLGKVRDAYPDVPFLAVTATATPQVRKDIIHSLRLRNPQVTCTGFDRPNLYLKVCSKGSSVFDDLRPYMIKSDGCWTFKGSTIIYCPTKKKTSNISESLKGLGVECEEYHAGLKLDLRKRVHEDFVKDKIKVIVATVAFGMGIDKPDVRLIIHYGAPQDIESYYQEIGRAGRDGLTASCLVFYNGSDFLLNRHFQSTIKNDKFKKHKEEMSHRLESYLETSECRRKLLLNHFNDNTVQNTGTGVLSANCCDNCTRKLAMKNAGISENESTGLDDLGRYDFTEDSKLILGAVDALGGRFGLVIPVRFLRGTKNNKINEELMKHPLCGKGKDKSEDYWKDLGRLLLREGYLEENNNNSYKNKFARSNFLMTTMGISLKGKQFLNLSGRHASTNLKDKDKILLMPPAKMIQYIKKANTGKSRKCGGEHLLMLPSSSADMLLNSNSNIADVPLPVDEKEVKLKHDLYEELIRLRNKLAMDNNCMPYMVASDKLLLDVTNLRPSNVASLSKVDGFNEARINKFGGAIVETLTNFCKKHNLKLDKFKAEASTFNFLSLKGNNSVEDNEILASLSETVKQTYVAFQINKKSLEDIEEMRKLKVSTITGHLAEAMKAGFDVDIPRIGFSLATFRSIEKIINSPPLNSDVTKLGPIKNLCPPHITWEDIKMTIAILHLKFKLRDSKAFEKKLMELFKCEIPISNMSGGNTTVSNFLECGPKSDNMSSDAGEIKVKSNEQRTTKLDSFFAHTDGQNSPEKQLKTYSSSQVNRNASRLKYLDSEIDDELCSSTTSKYMKKEEENTVAGSAVGSLSSPLSKFIFKRPSFLKSPNSESLGILPTNDLKMQDNKTQDYGYGESISGKQLATLDDISDELEEHRKVLPTETRTEFHQEVKNTTYSDDEQTLETNTTFLEKSSPLIQDGEKRGKEELQKDIEETGIKRKKPEWLEAKKQKKMRKMKLANL